MRELRLRKLQELVRLEGSVEVESIAQLLGLSRETIRRDLATLAGQGLVVRTRGGATAPWASLTELDLSVRASENHAEKEAIAKYVASAIIANGNSIALDTGTTTTEIARALRGRPVTVVTPSLTVISELAGTKTNVIVVGGQLRHESMGMVGSITEHVVKQFMCDVAFLCGPAINAELGLMDTDLHGVAVKQVMLAHARRTYAVLDHTKLERTAFTRVCTSDELTGIVTDSGADPEVVRGFETAGLEVLVAPMERTGQ